MKKISYILANILSIKFVVLFIGILLLCVLFFFPEYFTFEYWGDVPINRSETLRNLALAFVGIIAIYIAIWRGIIASKELENSYSTKNTEKLHKGIELLENISERSKVSGIIMLNELVNTSDEFNEIVFQVLYLYLIEHGNCIKQFERLEKVEVKEKISKWYSYYRTEYSLILCFEVYTKVAEKRQITLHLPFGVLFRNIIIRGAKIQNIPNRLIQSSDFSGCTIYCKEHTSFSNCDLTGATIYPYKNITNIFNHCNISCLRINIRDEVEPIVNGWHWEGMPPKLNSFWAYLTVPESRRIIIMAKERVFNNFEKEVYYNEKSVGYPYESILFDDDVENDLEEQVIVNEVNLK